MKTAHDLSDDLRHILRIEPYVTPSEARAWDRHERAGKRPRRWSPAAALEAETDAVLAHEAAVRAREHAELRAAWRDGCLEAVMQSDAGRGR